MPADNDVRGDGGWIVAPGTMRPDGQLWALAENAPTLTEMFTAGTLPELPDWLADIIRPPVQPVFKKANGDARVGGGTDRAALYARQSLREAAKEVAVAPTGARNSMANAKSYHLSRMAANGWIEPDDITDALMEACEANGLISDDGAKSVAATVRSGVEAGLKNPAPPLEDRPPPAKKADAKPAPVGHNSRRKLRVIPAWKFDKLPGRQPLIDGVLDKGCISLLFGPSEAGKTVIDLLEDVHIIQGKDWFGRPVEKGAVIYVVQEDAEGVRERWLVLMQHYGLDPREVPFGIIEDPIDLCSSDTDAEALIEAIEEYRKIFDVPVVKITIDTVSQSMAGGDENSPQAMGNHVRIVKLVRDRTGVHVKGIHHSGKDIDRGARGHSLLRASLDSEFKATQPVDGYIRLECTKQRNNEKHQPFGFKIEPQEFTHPRSGRTYTVPMAVPVDTAPKAAKAFKTGLTPKQQIVMKAFENAATTQGRKPPNTTDYPAGTVVLAKADWRREPIAMDFYPEPGEPFETAQERERWVRARNKNFNDTVTALRARGKVEGFNDLYWKVQARRER